MSVRTAVLVSGGGTNLQALIDASRAGKMPHVDICLTLSNRGGRLRPQARGSDPASPPLSASGKRARRARPLRRACWMFLRAHGVEMLILAGFMAILSKEFVQNYPDRILNVHPSLIPAFCGKGFYGLHVHEAALAYGVKVTGATVHLVNEVPDGGRILLQKAVEIEPGDTPEALQRRVMEQAEWQLLPRAAENGGQGIGGKTMQKTDHRPGRGARLPIPGAAYSPARDPGRHAAVSGLLHHGPQRQQPQPRVCGGTAKGCAPAPLTPRNCPTPP